MTLAIPRVHSPKQPEAFILTLCPYRFRAHALSSFLSSAEFLSAQHSRPSGFLLVHTKTCNSYKLFSILFSGIYFPLSLHYGPFSLSTQGRIMADPVYIYALLATLCFSGATIIFTEFANRTSIVWVNYFKALIATLIGAITISLFIGWDPVTLYAVILFMVSGFIGLNIGDYFMVSAFQSIGPGRTLLLYGFQPALVGIASYYFFGQTLSPYKLLAIIFL